MNHSKKERKAGLPTAVVLVLFMMTVVAGFAGCTTGTQPADDGDVGPVEIDDDMGDVPQVNDLSPDDGGDGPPADSSEGDSCSGTEQVCGNGIDDDCDGATDCADPDCLGRTCMDEDPCTYGETCSAPGICSGPTIVCASDACYERWCAGDGTCAEQLKPSLACAPPGQICYPACAEGSGACSNPCPSGMTCCSETTCASDCSGTVNTGDCACRVSCGYCLGEEIDTLDFFLTKHLDKTVTGETGVAAQGFNPIRVGDQLYTLKWSADAFELHSWDDSFIYLNEDHSGAPVNFYSFTPGYWMKRHMQVGETLDATMSTIQWYDGTCAPTSSGSFVYRMTLENHFPAMDVGGDLGVQDVITLLYRHGGTERYYYSREWGWIGWFELDASGAETNGAMTNTVIDRPVELQTPGVACIGVADAAFESQTVPSSLGAGHTSSVSVVMRNTGTLPWTRHGQFRLGEPGIVGNDVWNTWARVDLGPVEIVSPGETKDFTFVITAPAEPGTYGFQWQMVREGYYWFGALTPNVGIVVY
jgi:hypothetical protein